MNITITIKSKLLLNLLLVFSCINAWGQTQQSPTWTKKYEGIGETSDYSLRAIGAESLSDITYTRVYTYLNVGDTYLYTCTSGSSYTKVYTPNGSITLAKNTSRTVGVGEAGIWILQILPDDDQTYGVQVKNSNGTIVTGRSYTLLLPVHQSNNEVGGPITMDLWYINKTGGRYQTTFKGFNGINYFLYADPYGNVIRNQLPQLVPAYVSSRNSSKTSTYVAAGEPTNSNFDANVNPSYDYDGYSKNYYKQFFSEPDATLPTTTAIYDIAQGVKTSIWLNPSIVSPSVTDLSVASSDGGVITTFTVSNYVGSAAKLWVDTNSDGTYDYSRSITVQDGANSYFWDGKDEGGNTILPDNSAIKVKITLTQDAEIHFLMTDIEGLTGGIVIKRLNGGVAHNEISYTIYWDDHLVTNSASTRLDDITMLTGKNSQPGVHGWKYDLASWGNDVNIDNWAYEPPSSIDPETGTYLASGNVYDDGDGPKKGIGGPVTNAGSLYILQIDPSTGKVIGNAPVAADGTFHMINSNNSNTILALSNGIKQIGVTIAASSTPTSWLPSVEGLMHQTYGDGAVDGKVTLLTGIDNIGIKFGVNQIPSTPTTTPSSITVQNSYFNITDLNGKLGINGGSLGINNEGFVPQGNDPEDMLTGIQITAIASGTTLYYDFGDGPVLIVPSSNGTIPVLDQSKLIIYGGIGMTNLSFNYKVIDAAGAVSTGATTFTIILPYALPVRLSSLNASTEGKSIIIKWTTAQEINNAGFDIERSTDARLFSKIGTMNSKALNGNSSSPLNYSFTDNNPVVRDNYYRLAQYDMDGSRVYSDIVSVWYNEVGNQQILLSPNPATSYVKLTFPEYFSGTVNMFDVTGRLVKNFRITNQLMVFNIDLTGIRSGFYIIQVVSQKGTQSLKLIVK